MRSAGKEVGGKCRGVSHEATEGAPLPAFDKVSGEQGQGRGRRTG